MRRKIVSIVLFSLLISSCSPPDKGNSSAQESSNDTIPRTFGSSENGIREVKRVYK